jgi:hypothetical protein
MHQGPVLFECDGALARITPNRPEVLNAQATASKRLLRRTFEASLATVYQESLPLLADCLASPDVQAAGEAWRQRRAKRHGKRDELQ